MKKQIVEQRQPNEIKDADTPEFACKSDPQSQELIAEFEKTIEQLKKDHKDEIQNIQLENLEKLKEAQETVSQV